MGDFSSNNWVPLSSTHQFHTKGPILFSPQNPLVQHKKSLSSTRPSVPHKKPLSSKPKPPPTVQHQKPLSSKLKLPSPGSTSKTPHFHTKKPSVPPPSVLHQKRLSFNLLLSSTHPSVPHLNPSVENTPQAKKALYKRCGTKGCVELRGFGVELRGRWN